MHKTILFVSIAASIVTGCADGKRAPEPSFSEVFPPVTDSLMSISSPATIDLDGDHVPDIVFGTGVERVKPVGGRMVFTPHPDVSGYVVAVSGKTNQVLWKAANPRDAFTTPRFVGLTRDRIPDVVMGGREGAFSAFNGKTGELLWRVPPESIARTPFPYNFYTPATVWDLDRDSVPDLVVTYGGDDTRMPQDARDSGYVAVISGARGSVLKVYPAPDHHEIYSSPVVYERADGQEWLIFGTGGETGGGAAWRVPVAALLDGSFATRVEQLIPAGPAKGVIAPPTLVELTGDADPDIVISTFDGRLIVLDGATGKTLWQRADANEEAYHSAAVVRISRDGKRGLFLSRGLGVFPKYVGTVHRLFDAVTGKLLYEYRDPNYPGGAPLAVDLDRDGVDEPFFFTTQFPSAQSGRIHILHGASDKLITHDVPAVFWSTPVIVDGRGNDSLELIGLAWKLGVRGASGEVPAYQDLTWQLLRLDLNSRAPDVRTWGGYMGTRGNGLTN